jgi:hypothetical protein
MISLEIRFISKQNRFYNKCWGVRKNSYTLTFYFIIKEKPPSVSLTNITRRCKYMQPNYIRLLLNLEDIKIFKITHSDTCVNIFIETTPKPHICPCCGNSTKRIHDYCFYRTIFSESYRTCLSMK